MLLNIDTYPREVRKPVGYLMVLLLIGLTLSTFAFAGWAISSWNEKENSLSSRQLPVSGEGKVSIKPDTAVFTAGVVTSAQKIKDAQDANSQKSNAIVDFLKKQGIEEKDIKTLGYSIYPQYQYDSRPCIQVYPNPCPPQRPPQIVSYEVRNSVEVKVRDLAKVDELLSGVVNAGANEVSSIQFKVDDEQKVLAEARKKAIDDARAKAKVLARDLGVRLGDVVSYSDGGGYPIYARSFDAYGKGGAEMGGGGVAPSIQPGEQEVRANVTVVYEFR